MLPAQTKVERAPLSTFEYDAAVPLDIRKKSTMDRVGYTLIDLTYASPDSGRVPAFLFVPDGEGPFAGLLVMHGMPGSRQNTRQFAERYVQGGAVVLCITAPFSRPHDKPRQNPITFTDQDRQEQIQLIKDLRRGVDLLAAHRKVDPERIGYNGGSFGAAMGGLLAAVEKRIKAFVLWVGDGGLVSHVSGPDDPNGPFFRLPEKQRRDWLRGMEPIEPIRFVGLARPGSLFFQAARKDQFIPRADSKRYIAAGSEPKKVQWYNANHGLNRRAFRDQAEWLEQKIGIDPKKASW
jgi:dienelactone hydrolase